MKILVTDWWYKNEQAKAQKYNWTLCWEHLFKDENGDLILDKSEAYCKHLYNACKAEYAGFALFGEKIKETEKAVQYRLKVWNIRKAGRYITDAPVECRWVSWIPKSVML